MFVSRWLACSIDCDLVKSCRHAVIFWQMFTSVHFEAAFGTATAVPAWTHLMARYTGWAAFVFVWKIIWSFLALRLRRHNTFAIARTSFGRARLIWYVIGFSKRPVAGLALHRYSLCDENNHTIRYNMLYLREQWEVFITIHLPSSVFFINDDENDDENDENILNYCWWD